MIVEVPDENSIVKWKNNEKDEWKSAEISDLIKAYEERPQGEWIYHDKLNAYFCKDCGILVPFTKKEVEDGVRLPNFCHYCGADMRKGGAE